MSEFGYHPGSNPTTFDNPSNNVIWAKATTTPSAGTLTSISVFCKILAGSPTIKVGIYTDSSGAPGAKIADSGATTGTPSGTAGYVSVACSATLTASTQYWFAVLVPTGGAAIDVNLGFDTNGGATEGYFLGNGVPGGSTFPSSGTGATSFTNERFAIFGTYTPSGGTAANKDTPTRFKLKAQAFRDTVARLRLKSANVFRDTPARFRLSVAPPVDFYTTTFPNTENPISEGALWSTGQQDGLDWTNVRTTTNKAFGTETGNNTTTTIGATPNKFDDSVTRIAGTFRTNQQSEGTVFNNDTGGPSPNYNSEVECYVRMSIGPHSVTGYEFNYNIHGKYTTLVRWNGQVGDFTQLAQVTTGLAALTTGDKIRIRAVGSSITCYLNGSIISGLSSTDTTYTSGNPGFGFYLNNQGTTGDVTAYGFSSWTGQTLYSLRDTPVRFRLAAQAFRDTVVRLRLAANAWRDTPSRFRLAAQAWRDTTVRFRLASVVAYRHTPLRFKLLVQALRDTPARFRLASAVLYRDTPSRFRLLGQGFKDTPLRFRVQLVGQSFRDTALRFKLVSATSWRDTAGRFRLQSALQFRDTPARLRLKAQAFRDTALRFAIIVPGAALRDTPLRYRLASPATGRDTVMRLRLARGAARDTSVRFNVRATSARDTGIRFKLFDPTQAPPVLRRTISGRALIRHTLSGAPAT